MIRRPIRFLPTLSGAAAVLMVAGSLAACRHKEAPAPAVATPSVTLNHDKAPLGSPIEITYKFVVASDAHFDQDYRVMSHIVDADEQMMWDDDHLPPVPTTQWKPGQTIEYTRTVFVRVYPYVGEAAIHVGLYSGTTGKRLPLAGEDVGQRAYKVARLQLQPQTENVYAVYKAGWNNAETAEHNTAIEWTWTKKDATLDFKNPKKECVFYLDVDQPGKAFDEQHVQVSLNGTTVDDFALKPGERLLKKIPLTMAQLGNDDTAELQIAVDKTFVPALLPASNSKDPRELGVRVFHAFVDAR